MICIRDPSEPSRYPPRALERRSRVLCLSISQLSIVVIFVSKDHKERKKITVKAKRVTKFSTKYKASKTSTAGEGPRYYVNGFSIPLDASNSPYIR